jgi:thiol peroxidase
MAASGNTTNFKGQSYPLVGPRLKEGDRAPSFTCVSSSLELVNLEKTGGKHRLFLSVPSLDTPVCSQETKKFDEAIGSFKDKLACYTISLDMPFAQKRYCTAEQIGNVQTLSDLHNQSFGKNYGVLIEGLPIPLLARAVFVVNKDHQITYAEYVPEVGSHPNYDNAVKAVKALVG